MIRRSIWAAAAIACAASALSVSAASAEADICERLWTKRNVIYKAAGYCFKTPRAISKFGNAGCSYDEEAAVPLSSRDRTRVWEIRELERIYSCR